MSELARTRRRGIGRRFGIALVALSLVTAACSSDDNSSDTTAAETDDTSTSEEVDIVAEAKRITELAKAGLVHAAFDSDTDSVDIVAQTDWLGPTEPVSSVEAGKNVQVIMCAAGTACEVAANFVVEAAEAAGWTAEIIDGQFNPEVWLTAFDTAISKNPDAIIGIAIPDVAVDAKLKAARDAGIVTVSIADTPAGSTTNPYDAYVSYRMPLMHQILAYATIAETDGAANVVLINDSAFPNLVESNAQFTRVIEQCTGCSVTQVDWTTGDALDPVKADAVVTAALAANPNANYVVLPYSIGMPSAIEAVRKAGKADAVKVISKDGDAVGLGLVAKGDSPFNAGVGLDWVAYAGIDQVARGLAGDAYIAGEATGLGIHLWTTEDTAADGSSDYTQWIDFKSEYLSLWGLG